MTFDIKLLADPEGDGPKRESEWSRLFQAMTPRLRRVFAGRVLSADDLDDLVAGIWQRAAVRIGALRESDAVWSWLVAIGVNLLRDQGRARMRRDKSLGRPIGLEDAEADSYVAERLAGDFLSPAQFGEGSRLIREWLPKGDWELLNLWAVDELTHVEIASRMGLASAEASRQRVSRLCSRLRERLASAVKEVV